MRYSVLFLLSALALFTSGCSTVDNWMSADEPAAMEGERLSVLELQKALEPENDALSAQGLIIPDAWKNDFWPQVGGYPNHSMQHLSLENKNLQKLWSTSIGKGASKELPLTAQPVIIDGTIYTLDTRGTLTAFMADSGKQKWAKNISNKEEDEPVIGGGVSYSQGQLYATNGFNEALSLNPINGETIWRVKIPAPSRAAPTIMNERVFITLLDNRIIALNSSDGSLLWEFAGISEITGIVGAASPAANREIVVPVFSSGEVFALRVENGALAWSENLSSLRKYAGLSGLSDIRGLPVIDKGLVIVISFSGRMVAIDERTGHRVWQREIGGIETPWVAGNHIFVLSTDNNLVALGRDTGTIRWVHQLERYEKPDSHSDPIVWTGPVLAGNRLIVAGTNGRIIEIEPEKGTILKQWSVNHTISIPPVVAGDTLYLLANDGTLMAYN